MPIKIPRNLPARTQLEAEGVILIDESLAVRQGTRPIKIGLLNLMPNKIRTETQFARLLGATPLQVNLILVKITKHISRNTSNNHIISFYQNWEDIRNQRFDGFIITGAPIEKLKYEEVTYWEEMRHIFDWTQTNVHECLNICWGAQAAVYHFYGMQKYDLPKKAFGVFPHYAVDQTSPYLLGFSDNFFVPTSRWTEVRADDIPVDSGIKILVVSKDTGLCLLDDQQHRSLHMFNHIEYDLSSLSEEYFRDLKRGESTEMPYNYFPNNDASLVPENLWHNEAKLLFYNWLNNIYQTTPFNLREGE
ncbi:homoserine O-succinyltransferase family protein [Candidatus Endolissoclinum faulkneri L2]|uniref:Homoserine O-acetyltransferase n=1 Tax=Candidatus Endolissoclinum faulkneri L2 TaxID=1193729 RepID=K7ZD52_9PROT|nr:homoserine O-succinyltransferase [Candidatus Endolissoclinum faulkneri]AFX99196.1 homoserine O-succinyltransferase family protein [Candidatus Endolissoclinum faulkneri L2]